MRAVFFSRPHPARASAGPAPAHSPFHASTPLLTASASAGKKPDFHESMIAVAFQTGEKSWARDALPDGEFEITVQLPINQTQRWTDLVSSSGGSYRLCWCANKAGECDQDSEFKVEVGIFNISGRPMSPQKFFCV